MNLRCFIAIDIPQQIRGEIEELMELLKKHDTDVKWVLPDNIHITLKFLGNTSEAVVPRIRDSLSAILSSYEPFYIKIQGIGVFPNRKHPRVIWVGAEDSDVLKSLKREAEQAMVLFGYQKEDKEFQPHLTLGRVRSQRGILGMMKDLDNFGDRNFGTFKVDGIRLMKSELKPRGAEYTCLHDILFGAKI